MNAKQNKKKSLEQGSISVHTENLFPIIKKWLYSEHDIFLRELISNAHDAIKKLEHLSDLGEYKGKLGNLIINIVIDKDAKTLTISDSGLGMDQEEIKKYINQIAFSGAEEFLKKYDSKEKDSGIIGHFGLGFFSSFMVAGKVEIDTLSHKSHSDSSVSPVRWSSEGTTSFEIFTSSRTTVGTDIILHISEENKTYLEESTIKELVKKYSNFLPVEIQVNGVKENESLALWQQKSTNTKEEEYKEFYKKLFPGEADPLFHIHLDVDFPFRLKGILYFPKIKNDLDVQAKGRIKLFCNNVFVSDNIPDIIPQYLNLLQGVLDSPDIPLNVSRSFLQVDVNVKKIVGHITKKIVDRMKEIKKEDAKKYYEYWEDISPFIKFGMMSDQEFYEKAKEVLVFKKTGGDYTTLEEYQKANDKLKDKVIYANNLNKQAHLIKKVENEGVSVLLLDSPIDGHFIQQMEMRWMPTRFLRVDSDLPEKLVVTEEDSQEKEKEEKENKGDKAFCEGFKEAVTKKELDLKLVEIKDEEIPCLITQNEHMRRFSDMSSMMNKENSGSDFFSLLLNKNNSLVKKALSFHKKDKAGKQFKELSSFLYSLALVQQQKLEGEELEKFVKSLTKMVDNDLTV